MSTPCKDFGIPAIGWAKKNTSRSTKTNGRFWFKTCWATEDFSMDTRQRVFPMLVVFSQCAAAAAVPPYNGIPACLQCSTQSASVHATKISCKRMPCPCNDVAKTDMDKV